MVGCGGRCARARARARRVRTAHAHPRPGVLVVPAATAAGRLAVFHVTIPWHARSAAGAGAAVPTTGAQPAAGVFLGTHTECRGVPPPPGGAAAGTGAALVYVAVRVSDAATAPALVAHAAAVVPLAVEAARRDRGGTLLRSLTHVRGGAPADLPPLLARALEVLWEVALPNTGAGLVCVVDI